MHKAGLNGHLPQAGLEAGSPVPQVALQSDPVSYPSCLSLTGFYVLRKNSVEELAEILKLGAGIKPESPTRHTVLTQGCRSVSVTPSCVAGKNLRSAPNYSDDCSVILRVSTETR